MYPERLLGTRDICYVDVSLEALRREDTAQAAATAMDTSGGTRGTRIEWLENRNKEIYRSIQRDE